MKYTKGQLSKSKLLHLYDAMLLPRLIEEKMLILLRQGKISKWFAGIGQEAIAVGATLALKDEEYVMPLHRNLGVFTSRKVPLHKLFGQWMGKESGFTKGRDRSFHFGTNEHHICGMISHLGPQLSVSAGVGLAHKLKKEDMLSLAFSGEGGTSEGEFHEALNTAAVWKLPVIFLVENNGYGLSTPSNEQFACEKIADRAIGYGMEGITIEGNNILEVYKTIDKYAKSIRKNPRPILVECNTFRVRGHEEASGTKYVPDELIEKWKQRDPVVNYENYLIDEKLLTEKDVETKRAELKSLINSELEKARKLSEPKLDVAAQLKDVYREYEPEKNKNSDDYNIAPSYKKTTEKRLVDACKDGLQLAMEKYEDMVIMGQDVAEYGGVFKITEGFVEQFGKERVRNTTLCESAIVGISLGLSLRGIKSVVEMQFADFVSCGFNQIVNNLAKIHYRWGQNADVVIRMPTGAGVGAGPFHSQSNEAWFFHTPGLKIVYPSNAHDAKGLLLSSIEEPNPVMFFEHKALYRSTTQDIPDSYYTIPLGRAAIAKEGADLSIITYGMGVHWALDLAESTDSSIEILDLRTLLPWDKESVSKTVKKTGKVLVLHEDTLTGGIGAEVAAYISDELFEYLDGPVKRVGSLDTPVPFHAELEQQFLPKKRLEVSAEELLAY